MKKTTFPHRSTRLLTTGATALALAAALCGCTQVEAFMDSFHGTVSPDELPGDPMATEALAIIDTPTPESYYMAGNIDLSRIKAAEDVRQICVVSGHGEYDAHVIFAERTPEGWQTLVDTEGHVGKNGIHKDINETSVMTPEGVFGLGFAFGIKDNPGTEMEYRKVDDTHYWVDDPDSEYYNQWCDSDETGIQWESAEHLIDFTVPYAYSIFIQYNWPVEGYARSSAIFLHCIGNVYTGGCVSIPEEDMVTILQHIDAEGAVIVIANGDDIYNY